MVEATLKEVQRRRWKRVGVLTLGEPIVYTHPLTQLGIAGETTEIPFLIAEADDDPSLINLVQLLAEAAVKVASMDTEWTS
jgi:aspartate/glutamate racemase